MELACQEQYCKQLLISADWRHYQDTIRTDGAKPSTGVKGLMTLYRMERYLSPD